MRNTPQISIILPNYNNDQYLQTCLDSILKQTFHNFEIVILDDKSTDNSQSIINEYKAQYPDQIRAIFNKNNVGVSANRHNGLLQARGEYITTLDSDDFYYSEKKLESELELIQKYEEKFNQNIIAFSKTVHINENQAVIETSGKKQVIRQGDIKKHIMARTCEIPRDFIMRKSIYFEVGGYDVKIPVFEDWDLKIRLASRYHFLYTGNHGTAYRHHDYGLSSSNYKIKIYWFWKIFIKNINTIKPTDALYVWSFFLLRLFRIYFRGQLAKSPKLLRLADKIVYGR